MTITIKKTMRLCLDECLGIAWKPLHSCLYENGKLKRESLEKERWKWNF